MIEDRSKYRLTEWVTQTLAEVNRGEGLKVPPFGILHIISQFVCSQIPLEFQRSIEIRVKVVSEQLLVNLIDPLSDELRGGKARGNAYYAKCKINVADVNDLQIIRTYIHELAHILDTSLPRNQRECKRVYRSKCDTNGYTAEIEEVAVNVERFLMQEIFGSHSTNKLVGSVIYQANGKPEKQFVYSSLRVGTEGVPNRYIAPNRFLKKDS